jgi:branched-chain amino acid transport system permease protein
MHTILGVPLAFIWPQLLLGLINGAFYAMLSMGLAIIFGMLNIINFLHGAFYMLGAFCTWMALQYLGIGFWPSLVLVPLTVAVAGLVLERALIRHVYDIDPLYGLLLTFGLALVIEGVFRNFFGSAGRPYAIPAALSGATNLGFMVLPMYRAWALGISVAVCIGTWLIIERTKLGAYLRAATERPDIVLTFGINVRRLVTLTYALGVGLAALAGTLAAPIYQVSPQMGSGLLVTVFAVVVIGGMGSIGGSILAGLALGVVEGLTKVFYGAFSNTVIFVIMAMVILARPAQLFSGGTHAAAAGTGSDTGSDRVAPVLWWALAALGLAAPFAVYPFLLIKALCIALFACSFNLLVGYVGLMSFGHAAFFGMAAYVTAHLVKAWGMPPELAILAGMTVAGVLGTAFGWLAIRRQGLYFAMITLALAQTVYFFALQAKFTHGEDGIQGVPRGHLLGMIDLGNNMTMYYFVYAVFVAAFFLIYRIIHSPFGLVLKATRDNEARAVSLGYRVDRFKLMAFALSSLLAGLAGSLKALTFQLATLSDIDFQASGAVVLLTLVGGMGTVLGPVVGAFVVVAMEHYLAGLGSWVSVIQGAIFTACVLAFRRGIVGQIGVWLQRRRNLRNAAEGATMKPFVGS